jgi:3-deoxy-D-manno-octulosonic-acid transferase
MRRLYTVLLTLLFPFVCLRFLYRSIRQPAYRKRFNERMGILPFSPLKTCIWLHAVSVGEVNAALPLIYALKQKYSPVPILVTTTTPTGSAALIKQAHDIHHVYLPLDLPWFLNRFLHRVSPKICILMETELWPNLLASCRKRQIPVVIVNARLSDRSFKRYAKIKVLLRSLWACTHAIGVQTPKDQMRFSNLGAPAEQLSVLGNLKFDLSVSKETLTIANKLRALIGRRPVWVAASTHDGEEEIILQSHRLILQKFADALLILVPRHLPRFNTAADILNRGKFGFIRRTDMPHQVLSSNHQVLLVDTFGELLSCYAVSDAVFVGGSLVNKGGHNLLEPAIFEKPVISGSCLNNFALIRDLFLEAGALKIIHHAEELANAVVFFLMHRQHAQQAGQQACISSDTDETD